MTGKKNIDMCVAVPRFKKGNPDEWAARVTEAVCLFYFGRRALLKSSSNLTIPCPRSSMPSLS